MNPGMQHALIALAVQLPFGPFLPSGWWWGASVAVAVFVSRERRQSEEWAGSNRIPPWVWKPRALRDVAWAALPVLAVAIAMEFVR